MIFKRSFGIFSGNIGLVFKVLLYSLILALLFVAVMSALVKPLINDFSEEFFKNDRLSDTVNDWLNGNRTSFSGLIKEIGTYFSGQTSRLVALLLYFVLLYFLTMFFINLVNIPISKILYNQMSQSYGGRFYHALVASLGQSLLYSLIYSLIIIVIDMFILITGGLLFKWLYPGLGFFAFTFAVAYVLGLYALRISFLNQWIPHIVGEGRGVVPALRSSFKSSLRSIKQCYVPFLTVVILFFGLIGVTLLPTFGILPLVLIPAYIIMLNSIQLTVYFASNKRKYYGDGTLVAENLPEDPAVEE